MCIVTIVNEKIVLNIENLIEYKDRIIVIGQNKKTLLFKMTT